MDTIVTARLRVMEEAALGIVEEAERRGLTVRLWGSLADRLHCPGSLHIAEKEGRTPKDIDLVAQSLERGKVDELLEGLGFHGDTDFNSQPFRQQAVYRQRGLTCDVYFDRVSGAHSIELAGRLSVDFPTAPLAELLLGKLQFRAALSRSDLVDLEMLLLEHPLGIGDAEVFNQEILESLCCRGWAGWGLQETCHETLTVLVEYTSKNSALSDGEREVVLGRINSVREGLKRCRKDFAWRLRSVVGRLVPWYDEPTTIGVDSDRDLLEAPR